MIHFDNNKQFNWFDDATTSALNFFFKFPQ
jgi:hypothetical protein